MHGEVIDGAWVVSSRVQWDELDALGMLHNLGFPRWFERARIAFYEHCGRGWEADVVDNPDQHHVLKELGVEYHAPFVGSGPMRVVTRVERLGTTSCVYRFQATDPDGDLLYATGSNVIVKLDPETFRPTPWTERFREEHRRILTGG